MLASEASLLENVNTRLSVAVVLADVSVVGIVQAYTRELLQSAVPTAAVHAGTVYVCEVPSSLNVCAAVVGAVAVVSVVHAEMIITLMSCVGLLTAAPLGVFTFTV